MALEKHTSEFIFGEFGFLVEWEFSSSFTQVAAYEVISRDENGMPLFQIKNSTGVIQNTKAVELAESYLEGFIKWDGCTELAIQQTHWCGPDGYKKHIALLHYLYERAFQLMQREPLEIW